ncbi:class I SAM-dependent methyltransferase [Flavobacterium procerum]|uniref:Class I SAM-dependent methyltransferase n=1 Tax=Flavobacterium procerum TaxID=1455569 RepID=A0ABV6BK59_9FLAO
MSILSKLKYFIKNSNKKNLELNNHSKKSDDVYSMAILQPLLEDLPYLPFNGGALRPVCITYILNEIIINQRKMILEFGSGLSTLLMARLIKRNNINAKIYSVEHNQSWAAIIEDYLKKENLLEFVTIIRADLKEIGTSSFGNLNWYDLNAISSVINNEKFDLIIVDGPPANTEKIKFSRFPAFESLSNNFANDFCLLLDDANREGEKEIIKFYRNKNKEIYFSVVSNTLAVFRTSTGFNPIPIHY